MRSHGRFVAGLAGLALCVGCSSATTTTRDAAWAPPGTSLFSPQELARYTQQGSVADLLEHVSPLLLGRRTLVLVSIDGAAPVDPSILSTIAASTVAEIRLVRAAQSATAPSAIQTNGAVVSGDVLYVRTRK